MHQVIITGKPGAGKTTLLNELKTHGYKTISCDKVVDDLYQVNHDGFKVIKKVLGPKFVNESGVNKSALWTAIINQKLTIDVLNKLIHPLINKQLQLLSFDFCECPIIGSPYLDHNRFVTIKLDVSDDVAMERIMKHKHVSATKAQKIINLFQDNIKTSVVFNTTGGINKTLVQKVINYYQSL